MEKKPEEVRLRLKMVDAARAQLRLLQEVDRHANLYSNPHLILVAIYRYEVLWLPLKAAFTGKDLVPPLDIYWVWHCHMLSPIKYRDDTYRVTGTVVDHKYMKNQKHYKEGLNNARGLWKSTYPSERFEINVDADWEAHHVPEYKSKIGYDLVSAVARQHCFYYQVALSHYKDRRFLKAAVDRYKKYLCLKSKHIGTFLVPCYDFDLIWHAHQAHPAVYAEETVAVLERILNHDDSVTDREPSSKLVCSDARTRSLWTQSYNERFGVSGGMFRGEPSHSEMYEENPEQLRKCCSSSTVTEIRSVSLLDYQPENTCTYLSIHTIGKDPHRDESTRVFHKRAHQLDWPEKRKRHYGKFQFNNSTQSALRFSLIKQNLLCCCVSRGTVICSSEVTFVEGTGYDTADVPKFTFSRTIDMRVGDSAKANAVKVRFSGVVVAEHRRTCKLRLEPEATTAEELTPGDWSPVYLPTTDSSSLIKTLVGISRLVNHENRLCYRVRVLHSTNVMMSAVYVYQEQGLLQAVAHSVGNDQIPTPEQVSEPSSHMVVDPSRGERAMVVKDAHGDCTFCVGRWAATKHPRHQGDDGFLHVKIYSLHTGKMSVLRLPRSPDDHQDNFRFHISDTYADLLRGTIDISAEAPSLAPRVALSFAISVLFLLCRPETTDDVINVTSADSTSQTPTLASNQEEVQLLANNGDGGGAQTLLTPSSGLDRVKRKCSMQSIGSLRACVTTPDSHTPSCGDMKFMVASGFVYQDRMLIPSNDYIYKSLGSDERLPNVWYDSGGTFGGHDGNYSAPDGSIGGGSFGGCSGDAADYEAEEGAEEDEEDGLEDWPDVEEFSEPGACGGCVG